MNKLITIILLILTGLTIRAVFFPPPPIHIEQVHSASGVEYICIYESEADYNVAKLDENTPSL